VAHALNPSYSRGRDQEDQGSKSRLYFENTQSKKKKRKKENVTTGDF
jgi:hypothetical protein